MEEMGIAIDELDVVLSGTKEKSTLILSETSLASCSETKTFAQSSKDSQPLNSAATHPTKKLNVLPSISTSKKENVSINTDSSLIDEGREVKSDSTWISHAPNNKPSLDNAAASLQGPSSTAFMPGKTILAPILDRKTQLHSKDCARERSVTNPEIPTWILKHKSPLEVSRKHQNKDSGTDVKNQMTDQQFLNGSSSRHEKQLKLQSTDEERSGLLEIPALPRRRFSAPLSPRLIRRFIPEKVYSSSETKFKSDSVDRSLDTTLHERGSIFSPPAKEFDEIEDPSEHQDFDKTRIVSKSPRRSLDFDSSANGTRFLSDIKVSLADKSDALRKPRVKSTDKRCKNSYSLSASSEALLSSGPEFLPPVITSKPERPPRNRASSITGMISTARNDSSKISFAASPMFLDVESKRLSHLSLSPRLPRKF